jgi:hypothetical protein
MAVGDHVFLSYAREDSAYVERLRVFLNERGVETWIDSETDYGTRWTQVVRDKVDSCAALVVVMTPEAEQSEWVDREIHRAEALGKLIVPLLLRGQSFFRLGVTQYVDVSDGGLPPDDFVYRLTATDRPPDTTRPPHRPPPTTPPEAPSPASIAPTTPPAGGASVAVELIWQGVTAGARVAVNLDGQPIAEEPMSRGFRAAHRWPAGTHELTVAIKAADVAVRSRTYQIELIAGHEYTIVLRYARLRGNFTRDLAITSR